MNLYKTLLEDFLAEVEIYAAQEPDAEELHRLMETIEGLLDDVNSRH